MGQCPLHICATHGYVRMADFLLDCGAKLNAQDRESGWTALHRAVYSQRWGMVLFLVQHGGMDILRNGPRDKEGNSPMDLLSTSLREKLAAARQSKREGCTLRSFGRDNFQLGYLTGKRASTQWEPRAVEGLPEEGIRHVATAKFHTVCATQSGKVYCFGVGRGGKLGKGDEETYAVPVLVESGSLAKARVVQVAAAQFHSLAVTEDGRLFSWGSERVGQLGHGGSGGGSRSRGSSCNFSDASPHEFLTSKTRVCTLPRRVEGDLRKKRVVSADAAMHHSCALTSDGEIYTWGWNKDGQLGHPHTHHERENGFICSSPQQVRSLANRKRNGKPRVFVKVSANELTTCALQASGRIWQWGHGNWSPCKVYFPGLDKTRERLGLDAGTATAFVPFAVQQPTRGIDIACGKFQTIAATSSGDVYTWSDPGEPTLVEGLPSSGAVSVAAGSEHFCVVTKTGDLYSWGAPGALGYSEPSDTPRQVQTLKRVTHAVAGPSHTIVMEMHPRPRIMLPTSSGVLYGDVAKAKEKDPEKEEEEEEEDGDDDDDDEDDEEDDEEGRKTRKRAVGQTCVPSLKTLSANTLAKYVNIDNVLDMLAYAEALDTHALAEYCRSFIFMNMDALLLRVE
eukprot:g3455.t1